MNKLRAIRERMQEALVQKAGAITDERTGGLAYVLGYAWLSYCFNQGNGQPKSYLGNVRSEWRAQRAYRLPR